MGEYEKKEEKDDVEPEEEETQKAAPAEGEAKAGLAADEENEKEEKEQVAEPVEQDEAEEQKARRAALKAKEKGFFDGHPFVRWRHENLMWLFFSALRGFVKPGGMVKVSSNGNAQGVRYSDILSAAA